jgi:hypothetical protein
MWGGVPGLRGFISGFWGRCCLGRDSLVPGAAVALQAKYRDSSALPQNDGLSLMIRCLVAQPRAVLD